MRLDHLLSREKTQREIRGFIPRSMPSPAMELVKEEPQGSQELRNVFQSLCIIFRVRRLPTASRATRPPRTLTTVYEGRDLKDQIISVQSGEQSLEKKKIGLRRNRRKIKRRRAQGGCQGTIRRRRTWQAAKSYEEPQAGIDS